MKVLERNVVRLVVVQHLRATYGIKTKNWNKNKSSCNKLTAGNSVKVFGVPLDCLPHCHVLDYGDIPCFLADSCTTLLVHIQTEGLFRKSGSVVRLKGLRAKLDQGEDCLFTALPLDVAGLLKQFFRELPEPIVPTELHSALLKAQELPTEEERTKATVLLSCVLPDRNLNSLRYFFGFLKSVAERSADNKMDSSNLAVIFAPNLLHCGEGTEKMNANTEKKLKLMAAVVQCFIENAQDLGVVPQFLLERVPAMLGCEAGVLSPSAEGQEERNTNSGVRMSCRRSLGVFSSATPVIMTPNSKRKLPSESSQSYGFSNKKRRSIKKNLGLELLPNALFGASSTPGSVHSASGTLDSSQNASSSTRMTTRQCASTARRKSKRLSYRNISRVESGKAGCFSPRVTKKEAARKSLRLRFSLGRSSRDSSVISHSIPVPKGSETIGWRLATQESVTAFHFTKDTAFSPTVLRDKSATKGSKYISKSEDNLLTPQCDMAAHRSSWNGETPDEVQAYGGDSFSDTPMSACLKVNYRSEPAIVVSKPPIMSHIPKSLCCATSAESVGSSESLGNSQAETWTGTGPTLLKIKKAFSESGSDLHAVIQNHGGRSETAGQKRVEAVIADDSVLSETPLRKERSHKITEASREPVAEDQNVTFGQIEIVPLSPLHLNSTLFETGLSGSSALTERTCDGFPSAEGESTVSSVDDEAAEPANCSRLVDALDIQSPASFRLSPFRGVQSTPCNAKEHAQNLNTSSRSLTQESAREDQTFTSPRQQVTRARSDQAVALAAETRRLRVADHVQRFNMMTLNSPRAKVSRSPLKFQRTPVRQSVRRINSLVGERKQCTTQEEHCVSQRAPVMKAVSLESGLCTGTQLQANATEDPTQNPKNTGNPSKTRPPVLPRKPSARLAVKQCALGDVTNTVPPRAKNDLPETTVSAPLEPPKSVLSQVTERDTSRYRGSPKNPLVEGRLVSVCRPIDL